MNFNEAVIHDLIMLENDIMNVKKELKKIKRVNVIEGILIVYLLCKVGKNSDKEEVTIEEKVKEKCKKIFNKKR